MSGDLLLEYIKLYFKLRKLEDRIDRLNAIRFLADGYGIAYDLRIKVQNFQIMSDPNHPQRILKCKFYAYGDNNAN